MSRSSRVCTSSPQPVVGPLAARAVVNTNTAATKKRNGQFVGVGPAGACVSIMSSLVWLILQAVVGPWVASYNEAEGLDVGEHGDEAYNGVVLACIE